MCKKFVKNRKQLKPLKVKRSKGGIKLKVFNWLLIILVIGSGLYYLGLVNKRAVSGYKIAKLENRVKELRKINEKLEVKLAELQETDRIKQVAESMEMAVVNEVEYLVVMTGELAQR